MEQRPLPGPPRAVPGPAGPAPVPGPARPAPVPGPPRSGRAEAVAASPSGPETSPSGAVPPTVAVALAALEGVADRPLEEHVDVYDEVHRRLQDALASLDER